MTYEEQEVEMRAIFEAVREVHKRLNALAVAEPNHGYASVGGALDKMTRKAHELAQDTWTMSRRGFANGSQRIGGRS
jgi:hypothetical protein